MFILVCLLQDTTTNTESIIPLIHHDAMETFTNVRYRFCPNSYER